MIRTRPIRPLLPAVLAASVSLGLTAADAAADRIEVGASASVRAEGHIRIGTPAPRRSRSVVRARYTNHLLWGVTFAEPPPPRPAPGCYDCGGGYVYYPAPAPVVMQAAPSPPPQPPVFGLGVFGGPVDSEGLESSDLGLFARLRVSQHLRIEGEVSRSDYTYLDRTDRRLGAALLYDFAPHARLSPYLLGGLGFGRTEIDDKRVGADLAYGELGLGLEWRLADRLSLLGDVRAGSIETRMDDQARPLIVDEAIPKDESDYGRGRLGLLLYF